jgi:hypothetical protein
MNFPIDIWSHIASFIHTYSEGETLLWTCHNSRRGILKCFTFWARLFPQRVPMYSGKPEDFGLFCLYFNIELLKSVFSNEIGRYQLETKREYIINNINRHQISKKIRTYKEKLNSERRKRRLIEQVGNPYQVKMKKYQQKHIISKLKYGEETLKILF